MSPFTPNCKEAFHIFRCPKCDFSNSKKGGWYKVYKANTKLYLVCRKCKSRYEFHTNL